MKRTIIIYAVLLSAALLASYLSWSGALGDAPTTGDAAAGADLTTILDLDEGAIEAISYEGEDLELTLWPRHDERGDYVWVEATRTITKRVPKKEQPAPPEPPRDAAHGHPEEEAGAGADPSEAVEEAREAVARAGEGARAEGATQKQQAPETVNELRRTTFKASRQGEELLDAYTPMQARRVLGPVREEARLAELGLADPRAALEIRVEGGAVHRFEVGDEGYGHRDVYLRSPDSGVVYLVDSKMVRPLRFGDSRLPDRELLGVEPRQMVAVTARRGGQEVRFEHVNRDDAAAAYWARGGGQSRDRAGGAWLNKVFDISAARFIPADEAPAGLEPVFEVEAEAGDEGTARTRLEILRAPTTAGGQPTWYARSEHTRGLVEVFRRQAQGAADDLDTIFSAPAPQ